MWTNDYLSAVDVYGMKMSVTGINLKRYNICVNLSVQKHSMASLSSSVKWTKCLK